MNKYNFPKCSAIQSFILLHIFIHYLINNIYWALTRCKASRSQFAKICLLNEQVMNTAGEHDRGWWGCHLLAGPPGSGPQGQPGVLLGGWASQGYFSSKCEWAAQVKEDQDPLLPCSCSNSKTWENSQRPIKSSSLERIHKKVHKK